MGALVIEEKIGDYDLHVFSCDEEQGFNYRIIKENLIARCIVVSTEKFSTAGNARLAGIGHIKLLEKEENQWS